MAFAATTKNSDFTKVETLHDPEFVEWSVTHKIYDKIGNKSRIDLKFH